MFQIYYDLITCESDEDYENVYIPEQYARIIGSVDEKLIMKDIKSDSGEEVTFNELEQIAVLQRERAIRKMRAEETEKMRKEAQRRNEG